ncbi:unnamed protein product [Spirodela intermedia]|uniref:Uncharacterized protein n=1 Tax=Spirodela intermedia TaxID=51605 RepID=A0A7I8JGH5_SPIIN|nr:unnamed protein product [Spirodela intermedia]CAA6669244.1 unnamed protein product [Spirodela intermedia]
MEKGDFCNWLPHITYEGSRIRPISSTYNVMITLVYPFFEKWKLLCHLDRRIYGGNRLFLWKAPTKMGNSPTKLLVPGELILAKVEEKEMVERFGMVAKYSPPTDRSTPITPRTVQDSYLPSYGFLTPLLFLIPIPTLSSLSVNRNIVHRYSSMLRGRDDVTYYDHVQKLDGTIKLRCTKDLGQNTHKAHDDIVQK